MQFTSSFSKTRNFSSDEALTREPGSGSLQESQANATRIDLSHSLQETASRATRLLDDQLNRLKACQSSKKETELVWSSLAATSSSPYGLYTKHPFNDPQPLISGNNTKSSHEGRMIQPGLASIADRFHASTAQILRASPPPELPMASEKDSTRQTPNKPPNISSGTLEEPQKGHEIQGLRRPSPIFSDEDIPIIPFTPSRHRHFDYPDEMPKLPLTPRQLGLEPSSRRELQSRSSPTKILKRHRSDAPPETEPSPPKRHRSCNNMPESEVSTTTEYAINDAGQTGAQVQKDGMSSFGKTLDAQQVLKLKTDEVVPVSEPKETVEQDHIFSFGRADKNSSPQEPLIPDASGESTIKNEVRGALETLRERWPPVVQDALRQSSVVTQSIPESGDRTNDMREARPKLADVGIDTAIMPESPPLTMNAKDPAAVETHEDISPHRKPIENNCCDDGGIGSVPSFEPVPPQAQGTSPPPPKPSTLVTWNATAGTGNSESFTAQSRITDNLMQEELKRHGVDELVDSIENETINGVTHGANKGQSSQLPPDSKSPRCESPDVIAGDWIEQGVYASPVSHSKPPNRDTFIKTPPQPKINSSTHLFEGFGHSHPSPLKMSIRTSPRKGTLVLKARDAHSKKKMLRTKPVAREQERGTSRQHRSPSSSPDPLAM